MDQETLEAMKAELGKHASKFEERAKASEEKAKLLEERMAKAEAGTEDFKGQWYRALAAGTPITMNADETIDEFMARGVRETSERQAVQGIRASRADLTRRGLAGVTDYRGLTAMRVLRALCVSYVRTGHADLDAAARFCDQDLGDQATAGKIEEYRDQVADLRGTDAVKRQRASRALGGVLAGSGAGFLKPDVYAGFLDYLHPKTVVRALGAKSLPMASDVLRVPYLDTAATAAYRGQHAAAQDSTPSEKMLDLVAKQLAGQIVMSNELLSSASFAVEVFMRDHLARVMAAAFDLKALRGLGSSNEIRGFDWWFDSTKNAMVASTHKFNRTLDTTAKAKQIRSDLLTSFQIIEEENIDLGQGQVGIAMTVREKYGLMRVVDTQDRLVFAQEMIGGTLLGANFASTTQLPKTLTGDAAGSGTGNKSRVYVADFSTVVVGEVEAPQVEFQRGAAYTDAGGTVRSGFSQNESALAIFERHDLGCLYRGKEGVIIDSVDWGVAF